MIVNHLDVVQDEFRRQPPQTGSFGSGAEPESSPLYQARLADYFRFQQRVLAHLARDFPSEGWGYLRIDGDNLIDHGGVRVKVGRVCGPDGQLYKIGGDVPTANTPQWNEDGIVQNDHPGLHDYYVPFEGAVIVNPPPPPPNGDPPPVTGDVVALIKAFSIDVAELKRMVADVDSGAALRHKDLVTRIGKVEALVAALPALAGSGGSQPPIYQGEVTIPYLGTATITLHPVTK